VPAGLFAIGWVFLGRTGGLFALMGVLAALGAVATLVCTGQIYASLPTIRQWHHPLVTPLYLALALATGAVWLNALLALWGFRSPSALVLAVLATLLAWALKLAYWRSIDRGRSASTPETATGLGALGEVRQLDPPHAEPNYVMKEMGYTIARRHAAKLRRIAVAAGLAAPLVLLALQALAGIGGPLAAVPALLAALAGTLGVAVERWLFFAEATHVAMLYYGRRAA
jgi:DMSO reductase anchor subunit